MTLSHVVACETSTKAGLFPVADLRFGMAWSRLAPGIGGWPLTVTETTSGEMVDVTPPGAEHPVFCILPRPDHVEIIRERSIDVGGGQVTVACVDNLRQAVLLLCALDSRHIAEIDEQIARDSLREQDIWAIA